MNKANVYEAIGNIFDDNEVDTLFCLNSEDIMGLLSYILEGSDRATRVIQSRHEQAAVAMADGYARSSGGIGVCLVGRGPAVAQTGTALKTAQRRGSNVLIFVPTKRTNARFDTKDFDQNAFLRTMGGDLIDVRGVETLVPDLEEAFRRIRTGLGPVTVQVPWDVLDTNEQVGVSSRTENFSPIDGDYQPRLQPHEALIRESVELFLDSNATKAPVIIAGRGAVRSDARGAIKSLAKRINALLATTVQGRGYFSDHPFSIGLVGSFGATIANEYLSDSDFILAVGCSLNHHTTDSGHLISDEATVVHIDAEEGNIGRYYPVDVGITGDAQRAVELLTAELQRQKIERHEVFWTEKLKRRIAETPRLDKGTVSTSNDTIDPRKLVRTLDEMLPEDRLVVTDGGHFLRWVLDGISVSHPDDYIWTLDFSSIGLGLPIGIGAAAVTEKSCLTFCGDAGAMMSIQELDTAARNGIPITVIVMNDSALGTEYHSLVKSGYNGDIAQVDSPDIKTVASGLGAESFTVRSSDDLKTNADRLNGQTEGPLVVDCKIDLAVRHRSKM